MQKPLTPILVYADCCLASSLLVSRRRPSPDLSPPPPETTRSSLHILHLEATSYYTTLPFVASRRTAILHLALPSTSSLRHASPHFPSDSLNILPNKGVDVILVPREFSERRQSEEELGYSFVRLEQIQISLQNPGYCALQLFSI
ncbi:hypothetical protein DM860_015524 [Cuscuta australis]|uniref:Uncharacterized protein n=1 Tax=Cuscuta australis TaxID=267555 RepID=A0A328DKI8_9ASTE|nr:hypothetical protein DM860_015524 [Cuscuta australis]